MAKNQNEVWKEIYFQRFRSAVIQSTVSVLICDKKLEDIDKKTLKY